MTFLVRWSQSEGGMTRGCGMSQAKSDNKSKMPGAMYNLELFISSASRNMNLKSLVHMSHSM